MKKCARRIPIALSAGAAAVLLFAGPATATSPPASDGNDVTSTDQARVGGAIAAFAGVMEDAGILPEGDDGSIVRDTTVELDDVDLRLDANPAPECYDESLGDELPSSSDVDLAAYSVARSVAFGTGDGELEWTGFVLTGPEGDPVFQAMADALLPASDECVEDALVAQLEKTSQERGDDVTDVTVEVTSSDDLGVGDSSALLSIVAGAIEDGEPAGAVIVTATATTTDGMVRVSAQSSDGGPAPDEGLIVEALTAMVEALDA